ncbi:MAG: cob(I)yrinic acid a,c-diamide adenosyltransferase [Cyclobacteriaceae bacterium]
MKIYTKTGDKGTTALLGGTRVNKSNIRIEAYGTVDELNSYIGLLRDQEVNKPRAAFLIQIQERLFTLGSSLAADPSKKNIIKPDLSEAAIVLLEKEMDRMDSQLPELKNFILPGGHQSVSVCHITRCVCRRAERLVVELAENQKVEELVIKYLNRLSDYLFTLSREMSQSLNAEEVPWTPRAKS